jgi:large subunit ribosomal protein L9
MEIILKQYHKGLGEKNDIVTVRDGYARNFLIPQGIAVLATASAKKMVTENQRQAQHRQDHIRKESEGVKTRLEEVVITVSTLAGNDGKLFGSVTTLMVENRLRELGFDIDRRRISFDGDIKELGKHMASVDLHKEVKARLTIEVVAKEK